MSKAPKSRPLDPEQQSAYRARYANLLTRVEANRQYLEDLLENRKKCGDYRPVVSALVWLLKELSSEQGLAKEPRKRLLELIGQLAHSPHPLAQELAKEMLTLELQHADPEDPIGVSDGSQKVAAELVVKACRLGQQTRDLEIVDIAQIKNVPTRTLDSYYRFEPIIYYAASLLAAGKIERQDFVEVVLHLYGPLLAQGKFLESGLLALSMVYGKVIDIVAESLLSDEILDIVLEHIEVDPEGFVAKKQSGEAEKILKIAQKSSVFSAAVRVHANRKQAALEAAKVAYEGELIAEMERERPASLNLQYARQSFADIFNPTTLRSPDVLYWNCIDMGYATPVSVYYLQELAKYFSDKLERKFPKLPPGPAFATAHAAFKARCEVRSKELAKELGAFIDRERESLWQNIAPFFADNYLAENALKCTKICRDASPETATFFDTKFKELKALAIEKAERLSKRKAKEDAVIEKGSELAKKHRLGQMLAAYELSGEIKGIKLEYAEGLRDLGDNPDVTEEVEQRCAYLTKLFQKLALPDRTYGIDSEVGDDNARLGAIRGPTTSLDSGGRLSLRLEIRPSIQIIRAQSGSADSMLSLYLHESEENNEHRRRMVDYVATHEIGHWVEWQLGKRKFLPKLDKTLARNKTLSGRLREISLDGTAFGMVQKYGSTRLEDTTIAQRVDTYADSFAHSAYALTQIIKELADTEGLTEINVLDIKRFIVQGEILLERLPEGGPTVAKVLYAITLLKAQLEGVDIETDERFPQLAREWFLHGEQFALKNLGSSDTDTATRDARFVAKVKAVESRLFPGQRQGLPSEYLVNGTVTPQEIYDLLNNPEKPWLFVGAKALPLAQLLSSLGVRTDKTYIACASEEEAPLNFPYRVLNPAEIEGDESLREEFGKIISQ